MSQFLWILFGWAGLGFVFTLAAGIKTGFFWFLLLGLPATIIAALMVLALVVSVVGAFIGFVTPRR